MTLLTFVIGCLFGIFLNGLFPLKSKIPKHPTLEVKNDSNGSTITKIIMIPDGVKIERIVVESGGGWGGGMDHAYDPSKYINGGIGIEGKGGIYDPTGAGEGNAAPPTRDLIYMGKGGGKINDDNE